MLPSFFPQPFLYFSLACSVESLVEKCRVQLSSANAGKALGFLVS